MIQFFLQKSIQRFVVIFIFSHFIVIDKLSAQQPKIPDIRIGGIFIVGNKKTKTKVILREMTLKQGDILRFDELNDKLEKSRINLLKTPLFNYVTIDYDTKDSVFYDITVKVEERWYLWPLFRIGYADPNFNAWLKTKDYSRLNIGFGAEKYNVRGANENVAVYGVLGFERVISLSYKNVFLDKKRRIALSYYISNYNQKSVDYTLTNNRFESIKLQEEDAFRSFATSIGLEYRRRTDFSHKVFFSYSRFEISDSVFARNPSFFGASGSHSTLTAAEYQFRFDKRDSRAYPLHGFMFGGVLKKFGIIGNPAEGPDFVSLIFQFAHYKELGAGFYTASNFESTFSVGRRKSFYWDNTLGTENFIRGYEYYIVKGQYVFVNNSSIKYELIPQKIIKLHFLPFEKFNKIHLALYCDVYFDSGYVYQKYPSGEGNTFQNSYIYGYGCGLNLVTYYDILIRFEYSINKIKEQGLFIHFTTPF